MRPKLFALIAVSAIALVGCASGETGTSQAASSSSESPNVEAAPLQMSEEEAEQSSVAINPNEVVLTEEEASDAFIEFMEPSFSGWTGELPNEEDLIAAGISACESLDSGTAYHEVEAIHGASDLDPESALAKNNMRIVNAARSSLCMEHLQ